MYDKIKYKLFLLTGILLISGIISAQEKFYKNRVLLADSKIKAAGAGPDKPLQNIGCPASD